MIKPNDFPSANRQDDLLMRLKQCVGSIQSASKDTKKAPSLRSIQFFPSKQLTQDYPHQRKFQQRSSYRQSLETKQNLTEKKYHTRQQDYRHFTGDKQNSDLLKMAKNYLENTQQNLKPYRIDRKQSLPLTEASNFSNIKRDLFVKDVSDSTKKRIAERESLINCESERTTPVKVSGQPKNKAFNEDEFLERFSLRKISYYDQSSYRKQIYPEVEKKNKEILLQNQRPINFLTDRRQKQLEESSSSRIPVEKYQNYSKIAMENLVKDQDLKKAEKMQKLKKITNMNDEINKKIRRIVDTFQNYLTHREI